MIIGLVGTMGSGKTEVADYLKSRGFEHYTYSDIIIEIAKKRNIALTRENLQKLGTEIKQKEHNKGILSKKIVERIKTGKAVVDGIRNHDEIKELRKNSSTVIIAINAPQRLRYSRLKKRARPGDPLSFKEFKRLDNLENRGKTEGQQISICLKMADYAITNNSSLENLKKEVDKILDKLTLP